MRFQTSCRIMKTRKNRDLPDDVHAGAARKEYEIYAQTTFPSSTMAAQADGGRGRAGHRRQRAGTLRECRAADAPQARQAHLCHRRCAAGTGDRGGGGAAWCGRYRRRRRRVKHHARAAGRRSLRSERRGQHLYYDRRHGSGDLPLRDRRADEGEGRLHRL